MCAVSDAFKARRYCLTFYIENCPSKTSLYEAKILVCQTGLFWAISVRQRRSI